MVLKAVKLAAIGVAFLGWTLMFAGVAALQVRALVQTSPSETTAPRRADPPLRRCARPRRSHQILGSCAGARGAALALRANVGTPRVHCSLRRPLALHAAYAEAASAAPAAAPPRCLSAVGSGYGGSSGPQGWMWFLPPFGSVCRQSLRGSCVALSVTMRLCTSFLTPHPSQALAVNRYDFRNVGACAACAV